MMKMNPTYRDGVRTAWVPCVEFRKIGNALCSFNPGKVQLEKNVVNFYMTSAFGVASVLKNEEECNLGNLIFRYSGKFLT
jgi:hypothetical protein